ncbi:nitronate monooxygenase [Mycolicibacterium goodii]|uniref:NAD(P)H-dependent flavin oxidoreductase n=1 Tax=Mycolicibacterium goodii TaxID=134601 RepID=UPI001F04BA1A|nr:nitronate monooxygenase [Mycolicibacterium goodii]ULN48195.1 nitronate monooxygenase [Mycolicibacterium goodii]
MITTRLTSRFSLSVPILLAPMSTFADARLATAVTRAGGLGVLGAGYDDADWLNAQFDAADGTRIGIGFIGWRLTAQPRLLDVALDRKPAVVVYSFADPTPFAQRIHDAQVPLLVQVGNLEEARRAIDLGAQGIIAQGGEAGGHGRDERSTFTLVPEVADLAGARAPDTLVLAAGGVTDGRGLAAALSLGADGAMIGSRLWATKESPAKPRAHALALAAESDDTVRSSVFDIVRGYSWPDGYGGRTLRNTFVDHWRTREDALRAGVEEAAAAYRTASAAEDFSIADIHIGEGVGLIRDVPGTAEVLDRMAREATSVLGRLAAASTPQGTRILTAGSL